MAIKKHALLLFSKPPVPGLVKTRLTKENGGIFSPEQAAEFFRMSLYDVAELCMVALFQLIDESRKLAQEYPDLDMNVYDFFISTCPEENVEVMRNTLESIGEWPMEIHYIVDRGSNFNEHFNNSFQQIFDMGYDSILSVGADIPTLPVSHVVQGFRWLHYFDNLHHGNGAVMAPCQECGVSLIGFNKGAPMNHDEVFYSEVGRAALDAYREMAEANNVPMAFLSPIADVDDVQDLAHATTMMRAIEYCSKFQGDLYVPRRTVAYVNQLGLEVSTPPNDEFDPRDDFDK